jgi:DNA-binding LacI/PurR family transcriptional regulator
VKLPPTQKEIALKAGVTQACVSLVLSGSTRITEATRRRVLSVAKTGGYLPDLALSALANRRWHGPRHAPIVYLRSRTEPSQGTDRYLLAAQSRCRELGVRLLVIERKRGDDHEVQRKLDGLGAAGVIVGQSTLLEHPRQLSWERLRAVHCGLIVPPASGDVVCPDLSGAVSTAWKRMQSMGYRRIAAIHFADPRAYSEQLISGALLALEHVVGDKTRFRVWIGSRRDFATAERWLTSQSTDAVLGYDPELFDRLRKNTLLAGIPFAALVNVAERRDIAGMELPFAAIAEVAVDILSDRLRDKPGTPTQRRLHLIEMSWFDGPSLPVPHGQT